MSRPKYSTRGGEFVFVDFVTPEHFGEAREALAEAGVGLRVFVGKEGSVLPLRALAGKSAITPEWKQAATRLSEDVSAVGDKIKKSIYGFCSFGIAVPNPDYEAPVVTQYQSGQIGVSYSMFNGNEFHFLDHDTRSFLERSDWRIEPENPESIAAVQGLAVILQYRELI